MTNREDIIRMAQEIAAQYSKAERFQTWTHDFMMQRLMELVDVSAVVAQPAPVQDSTCNETLRAQDKAYPRTCKKCGKGPCIGAPKQPPAQPAPVQQPFCFYYVENGEEYFAPKGAYVPDNAQPLYTTPPAAQPAVPDALFRHAPEHPQYIEGWNDCRAEMLKGMK
jgi:hypothetical protein